MKCPIDEVDLVMTERQGIEIDYCPKCRGVWLDRGELDKIIDRSGPSERDAGPYEQRQRPEERYEHGSRRPHKRKRESFLGDLFDF